MKKPEPARLIDAVQDSPLRDALQEARGALGTDADVARVRLKLDGALQLAPSASAVTASVVQTAAWSRLALQAVLIAAGGGAMFAGWSALQARAPEPQRAIVAPAHAPAAPLLEPARAIEAAAAVAPEQAPVELAPAPARAERSARKKPIAAPAPPAPAPAAPASTRSELSLLHEAQDKLELSPQSALSVLDQHAREYPDGNFALERESLAIGALRKLGRQSTARTRAQRFVERFANAPQAAALRAWLERSDHNKPGSPLPTR